MKVLRHLGPGLLVTAAFIGPGTVTTASQAGVSFGLALLWAVVFAVLATIVLQEMAARLGLAGKLGLGEAIRQTFTHSLVRLPACGIVILAIGFGNAAYQTGNLTGASEGLGILTADPVGGAGPIVLGLAAFALLITGQYRWIERVLVVLVVLMSVLFVLTAIIVKPSPAALVRGALVPTLPADSLGTVIGLIGTTVVPYNLFLHASSVREKWAQTPVEEALPASRMDTALSISVGGLVTFAIVITAAVTLHGRASFENLDQVAGQLEPLLGGRIAKGAFALGLLAAGMTSAITAPLAAAFAVSGVLGWQRDLRSWRFRLVWITILVVGVVLAVAYRRSPKETILVAQIANGLLLPIIAFFLLVVVNRSDLMGPYRNRLASNLLGAVVVLAASGLGVWKVLGQLGLLTS